MFKGTKRFRILRQLGRGGTGIVYLAHDQERGIDVALKTLHQDSPYGILRLKNEFRGLAELSHPNLVDLHDLHHDNNTWFFTMEYVDGVDLMEWVRPYNQSTGDFELDLLRLRGTFEQLAAGLSALHTSGHLHRDIKPSNLLVQRDGRVVILDFGLATRVDQVDIRDIRGFSGTLEYMAPEQSEGRDPLPASDWYSFGCVLFQALTGQLPFRGKPLQVALMKRQQDGPAPSTITERVPDDLDALCAALLRKDPEARADEEEIFECLEIELEESMMLHASSTSLSALPRLIGRESQMGALESAYRRMSTGNTVVCSVHGRSGMGKSALMKYFLEPLRSQPDVLILTGRCYERESVPYKAFDRVFDNLTRHLNTMPADAVRAIIPDGIAALTHLFPVLLHVPVIADVVYSDTLIVEISEARQVAFSAAKQLFQKLDGKYNVIIHIDDVHWGDEDSVSLLRELLSRPDAPSILVVGSFHTEAIGDSPFVRFLRLLLSRESDKFFGQEIELGPLDQVQALSLARYLLRDVPVSDRHLNQIVQESYGNPFFLESLTRHLTDFRAQGTETQRPQTGTMTLDTLVSMSLEAIDENARRLLQIVAVRAEPLRRSHAVEIAGLGPESGRCIRQLTASRLLRSKTIDGRIFIELYHDRLRPTVLAGISQTRITQINLDIALCLERGDEREPAALVDHFVQAGDFDRARQYTAESARMADNKLAFEHAAKLYDQALEIHRESVTIPASADAVAEEVELLTALGEALCNSGRAHQSAKIFLEAAAKAEPDNALQLKLKAAINLMLSGSIHQSVDVLSEVMKNAGIPLPRTSQEAVPSLLAARKAIEERGLSTHLQLELPVKNDDRDYMDICWAAGISFGMIDYVRGADLHARGLLRALQVGEPARLARALGLQSMYASANGRDELDATLAIANRSLHLAETLDNPHTLGLAHYGRGVGLLLNGQWADAQEALEYSAGVFRESCQDAIWERATTNTMLFSAMAMRGDFAPLLSRVPDLLEWAKDRSNEFFATSLRTGYPSMAWLCGDDPDTAERNCNDAFVRWDHEEYQIQQYFGLMTRVHLCLYKGEYERALEHVADAWLPLRRAMVDQVHFVRSDLLSIRIRASLAALTVSRQPDDLRARIDKDIRSLEENPANWVRAQATLFRGIYLAFFGDEGSTERQLRHAIDALTQVELTGYANTARMRLGEFLGGSAGQLEVKAGHEAFVHSGVRNPERFSRIYAPNICRTTTTKSTGENS
ncbi:MAG: serine/threonine-protein kinase PknK [Bradymonadia bacterium]